MEATVKSGKRQKIGQGNILLNPEFWSIVIIFTLITLHHYDNFTSFRLFSKPDLPLGITRHTIDRVLYLVPILLASLTFGPKGGKIALVAAFAMMLPRALFISQYPMTALWESAIITLLGSLAPFGVAHYREQGKQLELSEEKYRQLFENAHDAIWVQDLKGNIITANQAAAELFGTSLNELIGKNSSQFIPQGDQVLPTTVQKDILGGAMEQEPYRRKIIKKSGSEAVVMLTANPVSTNGNPDSLQFIGRDITKEVRMQENQTFYLQKITNAHEEERQRISRDLHDSTAQNLIAMLRQLEKFNEEVPEICPEKLHFLWTLHGELKDTLQDVRRMSRDLRPSVLDNVGLVSAVAWMAEQLETENGIETTLSIKGEEKRFSPELEVTLFRIIQEALRNVVKHAEATKVKVSINFKEKETRVTIIDNGKGFELPSSLGELSRAGKLGIDGMKTRARLAGGTFCVQSTPGEGTAVVVIIPS